jgi:hypothetical protein
MFDQPARTHAQQPDQQKCQQDNGDQAGAMSPGKLHPMRMRIKHISRWQIISFV